MVPGLPGYGAELGGSTISQGQTQTSKETSTADATRTQSVSDSETGHMAIRHQLTTSSAGPAPPTPT
jgi:hypothetical protein